MANPNILLILEKRKEKKRKRKKERTRRRIVSVPTSDSCRLLLPSPRSCARRMLDPTAPVRPERRKTPKNTFRIPNLTSQVDPERRKTLETSPQPWLNFGPQEEPKKVKKCVSKHGKFVPYL